MANNYIKTDEATVLGRKMSRVTNLCREFLEELEQMRLTMLQMRETGADGSQASHYTDMQPLGGFDSTAKAKDSFDETDSLWGKVSGNGQVTDVNAAMKQFIAKLGRN